MPTRFFCTLFDKNYLTNFLALHNSLVDVKASFRIFAFCMDDLSFEYLSTKCNSNTIVPVKTEDLISFFPELLPLRVKRSAVEFYFTCSPFICMYVLKNEPLCSHVTYLDADLFFFSSPEYIFQEIGDNSIAIIPHNFYGFGKRFMKYGKFNVGWVTFKNNEVGNKCLVSWLSSCAEWCYDYYDKENKRFGDQKYLDDWERKFKDVKVITQKGANLAPWNVGQFELSKDLNGKILVDNQILVFYHFASFKKISPKVYTTSISRYFSRPAPLLKKYIYLPYLNEVNRFAIQINDVLDKTCMGLLVKNRVQIRNSSLDKIIFSSLDRIRRYLYSDYIFLENENLNS